MTRTKKSGEIPVAQSVLNETRSELKANVATLELKMRAEFTSVHSKMDLMHTDLNSKIENVHSELASKIENVRLELKDEIHELRKEIGEVKVEMAQIRSEIKALTAAVHRTLAIVEEQEARNRYALDGYQSIYDRQNRFEKEFRQELDDVKSMVLAKNHST